MALIRGRRLIKCQRLSDQILHAYEKLCRTYLKERRTKKSPLTFGRAEEHVLMLNRPLSHTNMVFYIYFIVHIEHIKPAQVEA